MDLEKVRAIVEWPTLKNIRGKKFSWFGKLLLEIIQNFSGICASIYYNMHEEGRVPMECNNKEVLSC
jgi:hypothetical protein